MEAKKKEKKEFGRSHPLLYIATLVVASVLLVIIAAPLPFLITTFEFSLAIGYAIIAIAGFKMGFLSCVLIDHFTLKEKNELIAGIVAPLPACIALYASFVLVTRMKQMFLSLSSDPAIADAFFNFPNYSPAFAAGLLFVFFNIPFIYYFYRKHEDSALLFYYMLAPVVIAAGAIIANTVIFVIMGG